MSGYEQFRFFASAVLFGLAVAACFGAAVGGRRIPAACCALIALAATLWQWAT